MRIKKEMENYAPLWRRAIAYILDTFIVFFIVYLPLNPILKNYQGIFKTKITLELIFAGLILAVLTILYWSILEYLFGQSLGKFATGIKVISINSKKLTFKQCLIRNLSKFSSFILLLDCIFILNKKHLRYLEFRSNTTVVRK